MSYILDALKKSEQERALSENPHSASVQWGHGAAPAETSLIPGLLIGLFLALVAVAVFFALVDDGEQGQLMSAEQEEIILVDEAQSVPPQSVNKVVPDPLANNTVPLVANPKGVSHEVVEGLNSTPAVVVPVVEAPLIIKQHDVVVPGVSAPASNPSVSSPTPLATPITSPSVEKSRRVLPPLVSLRKVPDLIITSHIYSSIPGKRGVSMNGRDWSEGDYINEDIVLTEINADGIVIEVDGWSLPLKRNKGWQALPSSQ